MGYHFLLQGILDLPGIKPRFPTLQADALPSELPGKPLNSSKRVLKKGKLLNFPYPRGTSMYHMPGVCVPTTTTIQKQMEDLPGFCWGVFPSSAIRYRITLVSTAHSQLKPLFTETASETSLGGCLFCCNDPAQPALWGYLARTASVPSRMKLESPSAIH